MSKIYKPKQGTSNYALIREPHERLEIIHIGFPISGPPNKNKLSVMLGFFGNRYTKEDLKELIKAIEIEEKRRNI